MLVRRKFFVAGGKQQVQWMAAPSETIPGCPPGLEYLTQVDQLLVHQQVELFESTFILASCRAMTRFIPVVLGA